MYAPIIGGIKQGIRETAKKQGAEWAQDKFEKQFRVVLSGVVDSSIAKLWREVLSARDVPHTETDDGVARKLR